MNQTSPGARGVFDLEKAVRSCFGKHDFFQQMVGFLFEEADPLLDEMRTRTRSGDAEAVVRAAHRLGNTLVYLGATPATDATKRLEAIGRSGNLKEAAGALDELARRLVQLMEALAPLRIRASG
jgi:HPt (histidine-containing phosphotransfer) domain-containing protein